MRMTISTMMIPIGKDTNTTRRIANNGLLVGGEVKRIAGENNKLRIVTRNLSILLMIRVTGFASLFSATVVEEVKLERDGAVSLYSASTIRFAIEFAQKDRKR